MENLPSGKGKQLKIHDSWRGLAERVGESRGRFIIKLRKVKVPGLLAPRPYIMGFAGSYFRESSEENRRQLVIQKHF